MYYYLTQAVKRRIIHELKDTFAQHPVYNKVVPYIQGRFAFSERPQMGIVVKGSSANKVALSADNYLGRVESHVMLAYVGQPVYPLEWVREDLGTVRNNGGRMPTPPGVYYIEILSAPEDAQAVGQFMIDPLLTVSNEPVLRFTTGLETEAQLQQIPVNGTLRLWENNRFLLREGTHYTADYATGSVQLLQPANPGSTLTADYRFAIESVGPIDWSWNHADHEALPGVVLAFGKRGKAGDKVAVVVYEDRTEVAEAYGGRFEITLELDVIARDTNQLEEMADFVLISLWAQKRGRLSGEGFEITDVSIGGEAEEIEDETGDEYFYTGSLSLQVQSDWEIHIPLPLTLSRVTPTTASMDRAAAVTDQGAQTTLTAEAGTGLLFASMLTIAGRNNDFERII